MTTSPITADRPMAFAPWADASAGPRITKVTSFLTAPTEMPLLVVKVETDVAGLIGWGCASSPQRPLAIRSVVDDYLGPMMVGRSALDTEDMHQLMSMSPYWRGGAIENNALAGIDLALWDIKGKLAGLPVLQLLGGQARTQIPVYGHAEGRDHAEVIDDVLRFVSEGYKYVRCQVAVADSDTYGIHAHEDEDAARRVRERNAPWRPLNYAKAVPPLFDAVRQAVGDELELLHDVHERVAVPHAIQLAKDLEPYRLFFLEDALAPEDASWYREMRSQTTTPQAVGEVFSDVQTFVPLITNRLIDFARIRIGAIGGITPTIKLAHLCELMGVRLAIHGPADISPIGHASAIAIDATSRAFGIQESVHVPDRIREVFPGAPFPQNGYFEISQKPGLGVEFDEKAAAKYPVSGPVTVETWSLLRRDDGSVARP